jgi:uncharacterized protein YbjT (DUF2867 family)
VRIVIAGGSGTVGKHVVAAARRRGHEAVVLSRGTGADVLTGAGLEQAMAGTDAVIDVTNIVTLSARTATRFFETGTRHLLAAEAAAGVGHHVVLSIVGIDSIDASYYAGKLAQERIVAEGGVPHTIARASQFHEFAGQLLAMGGPIAVIPHTLTRPVAAREVAEHLVTTAEAGPSERATDLVGPHDEVMLDMVRRQLAFDGAHTPVVGLRLPGVYGRGLASGALRGGESRLVGRVDFDEWLASTDHRGEVAA